MSHGEPRRRAKNLISKCQFRSACLRSIRRLPISRINQLISPRHRVGMGEPMTPEQRGKAEVAQPQSQRISLDAEFHWILDAPE